MKNTTISRKEMNQMIARYHRANGYDAPKWKGSRPAANGRTFGEEKKILDGFVRSGHLRFDRDELRYYNGPKYRETKFWLDPSQQIKELTKAAHILSDLDRDDLAEKLLNIALELSAPKRP